MMAIVNRTPDSFYDRGATFTDAAAMDRVDAAVAEGADIVDIGGVKAGPGAEVDLAEEIRRVVPFVAAVRARHPDVVISVDTWRGPVGRAAVAEGADLLNDTWAGADPALGAVAAEFGVGIVCSHTGGAVPRRRPHRVRYVDVVADVIADVTGQAERLVARGVPREGILVDPTHDFGKNTFHGLALLRHCDQLVATGWPVLMALSNKDFVGETLGVTDARRPAGGHARGHRARRGGGSSGVSRPRSGGHPTYRGDGRVDRRHQGTCPHGPRVGVNRAATRPLPTRT